MTSRAPVEQLIPPRTWWVVAVVPATAWLTTLSLVVRSRLDEGTWPRYGAPDPKVFGLHYNATIWLYLASLAVVLTAGLMAAIARSRRGAISWVPIALGALLTVAYIWFLRVDVANVGQWLAD